MTIEKKAHEAYAKNRELKPKYHIPESCWIDWFTAGYQRAEEDQLKIKPLEFKDGIAITLIGSYSITVDEYTQNYRSHSPTGEFIGLATREEWAIETCNQHYHDLVMSCFTKD